MVTYKTTILRYDKQGEKTGWTFVIVPADIIEQLQPGTRQTFKVKGKLDHFPIKQVSLLPVGKGEFIMPLNAALRKGIGKKHGAQITLSITLDKAKFVFSKDFMACLEDEPKARAYFETLTGSHQRYFSKWIDEAKTEETKVKRITMAVNALARSMGYPEMLRESKAKRG